MRARMPYPGYPRAMRSPLPITLLLLCIFPSCSGGTHWGEEMSLPTPQGKATIYRTEAVDLETAGKVLAAMVDANYNFASDLMEQIDKVDDTLTLRLCNDNEESIMEIKEEGSEHPTVSYFEGLAQHISAAIGNQEVVIILCEESLDSSFHTVEWSSNDG